MYFSINVDKIYSLEIKSPVSRQEHFYMDMDVDYAKILGVREHLLVEVLLILWHSYILTCCKVVQ